MKRLLLFTDILGSGGAQRQLVTLAILLKAKGYDILMLDYWDSDFYDNYLDKHQIAYKHIPTRGKCNIIRMFIKQTNVFQPDVVISYLESPSIAACIGQFFVKKKFKLIVSERNTTQVNDRTTRLRMNLFRLADYVVPNSFSQKNFIDKHYPFLSKKTITITNAIDTEKFSPTGRQVEKHDTVNFLVVGRVVEQKNVIRFIKALAIAYKQNSNIRCKWFGAPYPEKYLEVCTELCKDLKLQNVLTFYPPTQNVVAEYNKADAFILPSIYEGYPNVLCEAMACELPVIASNVCDNPTIVANGICGYLFNPLNIEELAECILKMASKPVEERIRMGINSRKVIEKISSKEKFVDDYIELMKH